MKLQTLSPRIKSAPNQVAAVQVGSWRTEGQTSAQRGYGYKWQKARIAYLAKHPLCVYCTRQAGITETEYMAIAGECLRRGIPLPSAATVVDHKVPHRGDMKLFWASSNWQGLCATHHSSDKQREEAAG